MTKFNFFVLILILSFGNYKIYGQNICDNKDYIYHIPGDIVIIGLFGIHYGDNCSEFNSIGAEIMKTVIETVHLAKLQNLLSNIQIGLTIYDTCLQQELIQKSIVSALVDAECSQSFVIGAVSDEPLQIEAANLSETLHLPVTQLQTGQILNYSYKQHLLNETIRFILHDHNANIFRHIDYLLISDLEKDLTRGFLEASAVNEICITKWLHISENLSNIESKTNVLIIAKHEEIKKLLIKLHSDINLLLAPVDGIYEPVPEIKSAHVWVILPTITEHSVIINFTQLADNTDEESGSIIEMLSQHGVSTYRYFQIISDLLHFLENIKIHILRNCKELTVCQNLPKIQSNITLPKITSSVINKMNKLLKINTDVTMCALMEQTSESKLINTTFQDFSNVGFNNTALRFDNSCLNYIVSDTNEFSVLDSVMTTLRIRDDSWIAALLSVCAVGVACCIAICVFIIVRLCKGDMLEGNPGFSFLMLFSMIIMYTAVLPFSFEVVDEHHYYNGIICGIKAIGTSLSYSLVFSVMLARSIMLASCDEDGGFMSHVNGYLQTILCFFIASVQIALTLQFWAVNWLILTKEQCSAMTKGPLFLYLLSYDMFLLMLLSCISPLIMKSKRNYHEGGYFAVSTLLCVLVWFGWTSGYILLPKWADLFVCIGLMATASIILISVFIPRTYLMLTGIVRDHIVSTLPHSLSHATTTSVLDVNYRSTQALYDSVNTGLMQSSGSGLLQSSGQTNPNYYAERPTTPSTSKLEDPRTTSQASNLYERYDRSPSPPLNVTRF